MVSQHLDPRSSNGSGPSEPRMIKTPRGAIQGRVGPDFQSGSKRDDKSVPRSPETPRDMKTTETGGSNVEDRRPRDVTQPNSSR
eukprot:8413072-Pyramimonas_sp.AAC.1